MMTSLSTPLPERRSAASRHATRFEMRAAALSVPLLFMAPYLALALFAGRNDFVSVEHGHALFEALSARQTGDLTYLGRDASPLLAALSYAFPWLLALRIEAAIAAGLATWISWRLLRDSGLPTLVTALLVAGFATTPALLFLSNAQASEMITVLLLLVAWRLYLRFTTGVTWSGFAAGLVLALAFFTDFWSILFVIPFAVAAPATTMGGSKGTRQDRIRAGATGFLVIAMPAALALISWSYVNWIIAGDAFSFSRTQPVESVRMAEHWWQALVSDMIRIPLYAVVAVFLLRRGLRLIFAYAFPLVFTTVAGTGHAQPGEPFTLAMYSAFAIVGVAAAFSTRGRAPLPRNKRALSALIITTIAVVQLAVNLTTSLRPDEPRSWQATVLDGRVDTKTRSEIEIANRLRDLPAGSVLADENAYAIVARTGTSRPFLLPDHAAYDLAVSAPDTWATHILVGTEPSAYDRLPPRFAALVPGFRTTGEWPGWRLLSRTGPASAP